jgi:hypothetical protein
MDGWKAMDDTPWNWCLDDMGKQKVYACYMTLHFRSTLSADDCDCGCVYVFGWARIP